MLSHKMELLQKYTVEIQTPSFVAPGKSAINPYYSDSKQPLLILEVCSTNNRSLAIVNNYLIVSSTTLDFVVPNCYSSGEHLKDIQVNTTGLPTGLIHAITQDDANHMVAITSVQLMSMEQKISYSRFMFGKTALLIHQQNYVRRYSH